MARKRVGRIIRKDTGFGNVKTINDVVERGIDEGEDRAQHIAIEMVGEIRTSMQAGGSKLVPSNPPLPPHVQTGILRQSVKAARDERREGTWLVGVTPPAHIYGRVHEGSGIPGQHTRIRIPAHHRTSKDGNRYQVRSYVASYPTRPFLAPAYNKIVGKYKR